MNFNFLHNEFKLQGISFSESIELLRFTKTNFIEIHHFIFDWFDNSDYISVALPVQPESLGYYSLKKNLWLIRP